MAVRKFTEGTQMACIENHQNCIEPLKIMYN